MTTTVTVSTETAIHNQTGRITTGKEIDTLKTATFTNTYLPRSCWGSRAVTLSMDVETAQGLVALLQEYLTFKKKEGKE